MKRFRFTDRHFFYAPNEVELGVIAICGAGSSEPKRIKQVEEESQRLKKTVADLTGDKAML